MTRLADATGRAEARGEHIDGSPTFSRRQRTGCRLAAIRPCRGGALPYAWPQAALATRYAATYEADYAKSWQAADQLTERLHADGRFQLRKPPNGTSRLMLKVEGVESAVWAQQVSECGVDLPNSIGATGEFPLQVNPSILRRSPDDLAQVLFNALDA